MGETGTTGVVDETRMMADEISATLGRKPAADGLSSSPEPTNAPQPELVSQSPLSEFETWRSIVRVCRLSRVIALQELEDSPGVLHRKMSLLTENYNDVLNNRQNFANPPVGSQPRPEPTETPLAGASEPTLTGERLYLPVPFRQTDLYIFDLLTDAPGGLGACLIPFTWSPHRLVINPARLRHVGILYLEAWNLPRFSTVLTQRRAIGVLASASVSSVEAIPTITASYSQIACPA